MSGILLDNERQQLIPEVAYFLAGGISRLTTVIPQTHVIRIPLDPIPEQYAYQVVRYCERSAWVEDPALIIKLLDRWDYLPLFRDAGTRIKSSAPPKFYLNNRVWDTCLLALDLPFLNREKSRRAIEYFSYNLIPTINPPGVRVLIVNRPEESGKSFTFDYILYVNSIFAGLNFFNIWVDYKKQVTSHYGPVDLIASLLDQINPDWENQLTLPELLNQQSARWLLELTQVLITQINQRNLMSGSSNPCIIVLDGFDDQKVSTDMCDLILILADIATGKSLAFECNDCIRLVLLGFSGSINNYMLRVQSENIEPINRNDVKSYFEKYVRYKNLELDAPSLDAMVDKVKMEELDAEKSRTKIIAQRALQIVKELFE